MRSTPAVLLAFLLICGLLSPPGADGQDVAGDSGRDFRLEQNDPDPANPDTFIPFTLEPSLFQGGDSAVVSIRIFNLLNQQVAIAGAVTNGRDASTPLSGLVYRAPGRKLAYWDGRDLNRRIVPAGVYYCQLIVNDRSQLRKIIVTNPRRRRRLIPGFGGR